MEIFDALVNDLHLGHTIQTLGLHQLRNLGGNFRRFEILIDPLDLIFKTGLVPPRPPGIFSLPQAVPRILSLINATAAWKAMNFPNSDISMP